MSQTPEKLSAPRPDPSSTAHPSAAPVSHPVPSRRWYGLAAVLLLVGVSAFVASLGIARAEVQERLGEMVRVGMPGTAEVPLPGAGRYLVYYERTGELDGERFDTEDRFPALPKMNVDLYGPLIGTSGRRVLIRSSSTEAQMFNDGHASSEWEFESPGPGTYRLTAMHDNPIDDRVLLAVGPPVADGVLSAWIGPFGGASLLAFLLSCLRRSCFW